MLVEFWGVICRLRRRTFCCVVAAIEERRAKNTKWHRNNICTNYMEIVSHWCKVIRTAGIMSNGSSRPPSSLLRAEQAFGMTPGTLYSKIQHENTETLRKVNTEFHRAAKGIKRLPRTPECMCDLKKMDFAGSEHQTASGCDKHSPCCQAQWLRTERARVTAWRGCHPPSSSSWRWPSSKAMKTKKNNIWILNKKAVLLLANAALHCRSHYIW